MNKKISSIKELKNYAGINGGNTFHIRLVGNIISRKHISYDGELFFIDHYIDGAQEELTEKEIMDSSLSTIGSALTAGNFYLEED